MNGILNFLLVLCRQHLRLTHCSCSTEISLQKEEREEVMIYRKKKEKVVIVNERPSPTYYYSFFFFLLSSNLHYSLLDHCWDKANATFLFPCTSRHCLTLIYFIPSCSLLWRCVCVCVCVCVWLQRAACKILVPWPGIEPMPPAVQVQSPNHGTIRGFAHVRIFNP